MGFFKRIFGRKKKNEIHLTPEEAYAPPKFEPSEAPVTVEPDKTEAPKEAEQPKLEPLSPDARQSAKLIAYGHVSKIDEAELAVRAALRNRCVSLEEAEGAFRVTIQGGSVLSVTRALLPGVSSLPVELAEALKAAPSHAVKAVERLNQRIEVTPELAGEDFENEYNAFIAGLCQDLKCCRLQADGSLVRTDGKLLLDTFGNCEVEAESEPQDEKTEIEEILGEPEGEAEAPPIKADASDADAPASDEGGAQAEDEPKLSESELRAKRSCELIRAHGILLDCDRAVNPDESKVYPRSVKETCERASALMATSLVARAYTARQTSSPAAWSASLLSRYDRLYGIKLTLTAKENAYLRDPGTGRHTANVLKAEACATLMWALGLFELDWPDKQVDIAALSELFKTNDINSLGSSAVPRTKAELLDMYDLTTRLHALCVRAGAKELKDTGLDPDVIYERHYALNWLLNIGEFSSWDSIIPTT
ncbi:MAG: DUF4272 domain-containing protein [Clostridia bacterium]|nr:DUF4272 domain-containing protein [Clostridia bacterium]